MPRRARLDAPGTLHHVIMQGIERRKIVDDDIDRERFVDRLGGLSIEMDTPVYAWALMSNHAHILLHSGLAGVSSVMRRLLTGYAINYNKRHKRHGHLFQNRYKSIVCEEETYFKELVRYIHLNPLRAGLVDNMKKLDWYRWSGHAYTLGRRKNDWQSVDYVLKQFGNDKKDAQKRYRQFVEKGIEDGRKPHLVGGGLIRSMGGWSEVKALRRMGARELYDDRILGSGDFVKRITEEVDLTEKYRFTATERLGKAIEAIERACAKQGIEVEALRKGSRIGAVSRTRTALAIQFVNAYGLSLAETACQLGVSTSAIAKTIRRNQDRKSI